MHDAGTDEQAGEQLRERVETALRVVSAVVEALPEGKPVPWNAVRAIQMLNESLLYPQACEQGVEG